MRRRIRIGYVGNTRSWEQLLDQIGVDWTRLEPAKQIHIAEFSSVIVDREVNRTERSAIENYLSEGGSLIDAHGSFCNESISSKSFTSIEPGGENNIFSHMCEVPVYGKARVFPSAGLLDGTFWIDPSKTRHVAFCGLPIERLWNDFQTVHRSFGFSDGAITAERTSALQSHPYMDVVLTLLKILHAKAGLPLVHKWWHPESDKHAATFRIDTDYGDLESIKHVSAVANDAGVPLSWFLHTAHHEPYLDELIHCIPERDEIALHCYHHSEYDTVEQYISDIKSGLKTLNKSNIEPKGYVAPYGNWSRALAESLSSTPFSYTSEFGYDFDSLPSTSPTSGIMQLPVHPITIGSFRRFKSNLDKILNYFEKVIQLKKMLHQPLHLYHHPLDSTPKNWAKLVGKLNRDEYTLMTYSEWSNWWKKRSSAHISPTFDSESGQIQIKNGGLTKIPLSIHWNDQFHVSDRIKPSAYLDKLSYQPYIQPGLNQLVAENRSAKKLSNYGQIKDGILTWLWRNRA